MPSVLFPPVAGFPHDNVTEVLQRFSMENMNSVGSTLPTNNKLSGKQSLTTKAKKVEMMKVPYASAVKSLMYTMVCTWSYIGYVVGMVNQFMSNLGREH